jgi:hypothetical protein
MSIDDPIVTWSEFGQTQVIDVEQGLRIYDDGGHALGLNHGPCVISILEGSEQALYLLEEGLGDVGDVLCISVRRTQGMHVSWWTRLESIARDNDIYLTEHRRHDVLSTVAFRLFQVGSRAIEDCADIIRGEGIDPSSEAMRTEKALTKAIDVLRASGFRVPKTR